MTFNKRIWINGNEVRGVNIGMALRDCKRYMAPSLITQHSHGFPFSLPQLKSVNDLDVRFVLSLCAYPCWESERNEGRAVSRPSIHWLAYVQLSRSLRFFFPFWLSLPPFHIKPFMTWIRIVLHPRWALHLSEASFFNNSFFLLLVCSCFLQTTLNYLWTFPSKCKVKRQSCVGTECHVEETLDFF